MTGVFHCAKLIFNMLIIRLQRVGRTNDPNYRLVVLDSKRAAKSGNFLEILGSYDPRKKRVALKNEQIKSWLLKGAQVSDTAHNLLVNAKIIESAKINVVKPPKKAAAAEAPKVT